MKAEWLFPADTFTYAYLAGPVLTADELDIGITEGNCRLALQLYFYRQHNLFLGRDEIYIPGGYKTFGDFIYKEEMIDFSSLIRGDIVYAQNLRNKHEALLVRGQDNFPDYDTWVYHFHSGIYIGRISPHDDAEYIYHATSIDNGPALWPLDKFTHYYLPISIKRISLKLTKL